MENSPFIFSGSCADYEIISRVDNEIYFEIELLCDGVKNNLQRIKYMEVDVLINTYMHQCKFMVEHVLDYVRKERKTTLRFLKSADESTRVVFRVLHLKELQMSQSNMKEAFERFEEAVSFIYPGDSCPDFLLGIKVKMDLIVAIMADLFYFERTKLIRQKATSFADTLSVECNLMN